MEEFSWGFVTYLKKKNRGQFCVLGPVLKDFFLGYLLLEEALGSMKTKGCMTLTEVSPTKL